MQKFVKLPLIFFFVAAVIGAVLRWHQAWPINGLTYSFWLHGHSHIMFLGWVFNALSVNFVLQFVPPNLHGRYRHIFLIINILLGGMLLSFPIGGYNLYSIVLSTLHTIFVVLFTYRFFHDAISKGNNLALGYARWALFFFLISSIGPFALGGLVANAMEQSLWYRLAVYFYLHFQYNGTFTFGILALLYCLLNQHQITVKRAAARNAQILFCITCIPAYILSTLYLKPGLIYNVIGFISASIQLIAFAFLVKSIDVGFKNLLSKFSTSTKILLAMAFLSFAAKLILQLVSSVPTIAVLANDIRHYAIAYIHLVLVGMISFFLLAWYQANHFIPRIKWYTMVMLLVGYLGSELAMISVGFIPGRFVQTYLSVATVLMAIGLCTLIFSSRQKFSGWPT